MKLQQLKFRTWSIAAGKMASPFTMEDVYDIHTNNIDVGKARYPFNNYIVMQFTGCLDKNKQEIYQGDIVSWKYKGKDETGEVYFEDAQFKVRGYFNPRLDIPSDAFGEGLSTLKVVGNMYKDPELLSNIK